MAEYHVSCGAFGIYAGTLNPRNHKLWKEKSDCTDEAINAVRDYMIRNLLGGFDCNLGKSNAYIWDLKSGKQVELRISIRDAKEAAGNEGD